MSVATIAETISHFFDPILVFAVLGMLAIFRSGLADLALLRMLLIFLLVMILPPALLLGWAVKNKKVTNWDVSDRRQRVKVLAIFLIMILIGLILIKIFGNSGLFNLFIFFSIWYLGFFIITLFWKISGHMAAVTLATLFIVRWYGVAWWPAFLLIPLLGWARVVSKNHSLGQVVAGIMYSWMVFEFVKFA